jgi:plastocyanin
MIRIGIGCSMTMLEYSTSKGFLKTSITRYGTKHAMGDNIFLLLLIFLTLSLLTPAVSEAQTQDKGKSTTVIMPLGSSAASSGAGYEPTGVTISPGASVIWDNQDNALHTATSGNPDTATPDGKFDTGLVGANQQSKPVTMPTEPGEYRYFCTLHPFLVGTVTITSSSPRTEEPSNLIADTSGVNMSSNTGLLAVLLDDVSRDLQNGDIPTALLHLDVVKQELENTDNQYVEVLVNDAIKDLDASQPDRALLHLNLAKRHLSVMSDSDVPKRNQTSTPPSPTRAHDNYLRYDNTSYGISIQYPSDWTFGHYDFDPYDTFVFVVTFEAPFENSSDQYAEKVDVAIDMTGQPGNLHEYLDYVIDSYKGKSDFHVYESHTNITLGGHPAYTVVFRSLDNMTFVKHRTLEVGTIIGDIVYYLTYDAEQSKYDDYLPTVQKMIESFKVTDVGLQAQNQTYVGSTENLTSSYSYENITSYSNLTSGNVTIYPYTNATFGMGQPYQAPPQPLAQQPQIDWIGVCSTLQPALLSSCTSLVSSNGTLTYEGNRAVGCIRNGALLAAAAGLNAIPLEWIIGGLQALEGPTGCSGIVNWEMLNQIGGTDTILDLTQ